MKAGTYWCISVPPIHTHVHKHAHTHTHTHSSSSNQRPSLCSSTYMLPLTHHPSNPDLRGKVRHIEQLELSLEQSTKTAVVEDSSQLARAARELVATREREGASQRRILDLEHDLGVYAAGRSRS